MTAKKTKKKTGGVANTHKKRIKVATLPVDYSKPLKNARYERFAQEYGIDLNKTQAAIRAKYSKKTAGQKGEQLFKIIVIKNRINYLQSQLSKRCDIDAEMVLAEFAIIAFGKVSKTLNNKHKIAALENIGKHIGFYEKDNAQKKDNLADFLKAFKDE